MPAESSVSSTASNPSPHHSFATDGTSDNGEWFYIDGVESFSPFLVSIVSDEDHWLFAASNGGMTAGRGSPDMSLFPYYTQDKLIDLAPTTGPVTRIRWSDGSVRKGWAPFDPRETHRSRRISKRLDGTKLAFEECSEPEGLHFRYSLGFSRRFGFVRKATLRNLGSETRTIELIDGFQNMMPCGVSDDFQNDYSILVDAYKRAEWVEGTSLRLIYLSSIPTDRAEPTESLRATTAWTCGLTVSAYLLTTRQLDAFMNGDTVTSEKESRGLRAGCLDYAQLVLAPGESRTWYTVAEVGQSTAQVSRLYEYLMQEKEEALIEALETELFQTSDALRRKVASADGLQLSHARRRISRHFSNVMFNIMRGGVFLENGLIHRDHFLAHLFYFNRPLAERWAKWGASLPEVFHREEIEKLTEHSGDFELERLAGEYLPLTFSRRHGDPSRPWNRFAINVRDNKGRPRFAYQGNWRDIFQNWETLMHSFPGFIEGAIFRFLNATTADGYNPYRMTHEGFEWETIDPNEPWSNIGYWGDHQIIYLLRLLEASRRFHPDRLDALLHRPVFAYARIPYRIRSYNAILSDPRSTIDYDTEADAAIAERVAALGADGRLLAAADGTIVHVTLLEKLLVPILAKLANFVPGGGIWMNTQRPDWNDANNALVGYGVSVVTMAYCHRYIAFLLDWLGGREEDERVPLSAAVSKWLEAQTSVFRSNPTSEDMSSGDRRKFLDALGLSASEYRHNLYEDGLSGEICSVPVARLHSFLSSANEWLSNSLRGSRRADGLYHSYNLLRFDGTDGVHVEPLYEMLEGQVAILSAHLLRPEEALSVMQALRSSHLYRADQQSYLLYPDRDLPKFLEKNRIDPQWASRSALLGELAKDPDQSIVEFDGQGVMRFAGTLRNAQDLGSALAALPDRWAKLVQSEGAALMDYFENIFAHRAFTGRSGTFFAYEGLGSIYWHMVSKLVLAVQENVLACALIPQCRAIASDMADFYEETLLGLGMEKSPSQYGSFPTDAYSHTPRHAGAQQPGMTGQVKEDILVRWGELGVVVKEGCLEFCPRLLREEELLTEPGKFRYVDVNGVDQVLLIPADAMAFTFCQVPIIYRAGSRAHVSISSPGKEPVLVAGTRLSAVQSQSLFQRRGTISQIQVEIPKEWFRSHFFGT